MGDVQHRPAQRLIPLRSRRRAVPVDMATACPASAAASADACEAVARSWSRCGRTARTRAGCIPSRPGRCRAGVSGTGTRVVPRPSRASTTTVGIRRLGQIVDGAAPQCHHHGREAVEPRDHDDPRRLIDATQLLDQIEAAAVAQTHLDHGEGEGPLRRGRQRRPAAGDRGDLESARRERVTSAARLPTSWSTSSSGPAAGSSGSASPLPDSTIEHRDQLPAEKVASCFSRSSFFCTLPMALRGRLSAM